MRRTNMKDCEDIEDIDTVEKLLIVLKTLDPKMQVRMSTFEHKYKIITRIYEHKDICYPDDMHKHYIILGTF